MSGFPRARVVVFAALLATAGCSHRSATAPPVGQVKVWARQGANGADPRLLLVIRIRMTAVEVPAGTISRSDELWRCLDEEPFHAQPHFVPRLNGLRVALGREGSRPEVGRILRRATGREIDHAVALILPGRSTDIKLKKLQPAKTIFGYEHDRTLSGRDYPPGDYVLTLTCDLDADDPSRISLAVLPRVLSTHRVRRIVRAEGRINWVSQPESFDFGSLQFAATMRQGAFLVIGPDAECERQTSVGRHFLVKEKEGIPFETVLVLSPEAVAAKAE
jgi:hypothetical protein